MKRTLALTAVMLSALLLSGCTSGAQTATSGGQVVTPYQAPDSGKGTPGVVQGEAADLPAANRDVVTTGQVSLTVDDPIRSAQDAVRITERAGGRIDSRTENPGTPNQPASANLTLRIPADSLDRTLTELKKLGTVNFVSLNASDVTQQTQDLDARISALQTSVDRLLDLMSKATSTTDLIAIESALSERQANLESMQSQRTAIGDQIDYSTIGLDLYSTGTIAPGAPDNFWTAIVAGWNAFVATLGGFAVAFGYALPWIVALALAGLIVAAIVWASTRKRNAERRAASESTKA
ncbi:DUF4349 domain-containing protein [Glaciibacter sp. 2TAF33]|uniref:DUF4349 domain-containing protein n=1 Tax=Glaciibacter sp. 2TAF33 TaxID=3233015 RepID=UPI003F92D3C1